MCFFNPGLVHRLVVHQVVNHNAKKPYLIIILSVAQR